MTEKRTSIFENGLIWFGAGVSLAEILTGTYFASLGFGKGLLAIIIGHIIGCTMLLLAGVIGGKTRRSAMETVKMSFGEKGGIFFSFLNDQFISPVCQQPVILEVHDIPVIPSIFYRQTCRQIKVYRTNEIHQEVLQ